MKKNVLVIGAGPAGLTAALELVKNSDLNVMVLEASEVVGGISRTVRYRGNSMDIGGHRFFSKNDWVMNWWKSILPVAPDLDRDGVSVVPSSGSFFLIRSRLSRIYFLRRFFDYPISLSKTTLANLGVSRVFRMGFSYLTSSVFKRSPETNLEDFFINRFGVALYKTFFKDYTEKVWGVPCREISASWGAQRIKGLSIRKALGHAIARFVSKPSRDVSQKSVETSLIERFFYPTKGPGELWEKVSDLVCAQGGQVNLGETVCKINISDGKVLSISSIAANGESKLWNADFVISTMPIRDLVQSVEPPISNEVSAVANGLVYRDFVTMGVLVSKMKEGMGDGRVPDTWIYIQEPDVKIGRLQIFNNWSPLLVKDPETIWLGLEYFCQEGDELWSLGDADFSEMALAELDRLGFVHRSDVLDWHIERVPKAYPAYFGSYDRFDVIKDWADEIPNLFLVGRNGMHRYNNQDHSMLAAKAAVDSILGKVDKKAIWDVNAEESYHEEK